MCWWRGSLPAGVWGATHGFSLVSRTYVWDTQVNERSRTCEGTRAAAAFRVYWCPAGHYHMTSSEAYQNPPTTGGAPDDPASPAPAGRG
jgi:hypothetical protein